MKLLNRLLHKNIYIGTVVDLKEINRVDEKTAYDGVATTYYEILNHHDSKKVGKIELRLTVDGEMYYYGHVGYNVIDKYRGHNYAYYACLLLFEIARKEYGMKEIIITCSPENKASYQTLLKLNGELVELVDVPKNHTLYRMGETRKYVFKYRI